MTTTEVSASWLPDCTLGPLCPFLEVSAVSGSTVGEAVAPGADWAESAPASDCGAGVGEDGAVEQLATASAHEPTPAKKTAGFFMDGTPIRSTQIRGDIEVCRYFQLTAAAAGNAAVVQE